MKSDKTIPSPVASYQDELQRVKEQLRRSEERYQQLLESGKEHTRQLNSMIGNLPGFVYRCKYDEHWTMVYVSEGCLAITGYSPDDLINNKTTSFNMVIKEAYRDHLFAKWKQTINDMVPFYEEYEITTASGETRWVLEQAVAVYDNNGDVQFLEGYIDDITQKQALNEALTKSESKYRYLFESNPAPMWIYDEETLDFLEVNAAAIEHYGYTRKEFLQRTIKDIRPKEDVDRLVKDVDETTRVLNRAGTWRHQKKNGDLIYVDIVSHRLDYEDIKARLVISTDITQRILLQQELVKAKEKAEESDRLKSAFLANMSHEIRTPMNSIIGFISLLQEENLTAAEKSEYLDIVRKNGDRLLSTLNDIVDVSKIESGQVVVNPSVFDLNEVMINCFGLFRQDALIKGLEFKRPTLLMPDVSFVRTDKDKLYSIVTNLVKNALKYTQKGFVAFDCSISNGELFLTVVDSGIGIPYEKQRAIFERFIQVDSHRKSTFEGAGLGLAITKAFVELLGGEITVESEEGKGSTFYVRIPIEIVSPEMAADV